MGGRKSISERGKLLVRLARSLDFKVGEFGQALESITESASDALDVDRVGVWTFDEPRQSIICTALWDRSESEHSPGSSLLARDYPAYFAALEEDLTIPAGDAHSDPRTCEFSKSYLTPLGIESMLDVPVRLHGEMIGVVCFESRLPRDWTPGEQMFAAYIGDLVSHAIETDRHRRLEGRLLQAQKLEAIGLLASGITHDLNNILAPIQGYCEFLLQEDVSPVVEDGLQQILTAAQRGAALVHRIMGFTRKATIERGPVDLAAAVGESLQLVRACVPATIAVALESSPCPRVLGDPVELQQIVLNLCINAAQSMGTAGGRITLRVGSRRADARLAERHGVMEGAELVRLRVEDTGSGVDSSLLAQIFEPFFSTKDDGAGLGLASVADIVVACGGFIEVTSTPGRGSRFDVCFPPAPEPKATTAEKVSDLDGPCEARILVVDDEEQIVDVMKQYLTSRGCVVAGTTSASEALTTLLRHADDYDLVLCDLTMPEISGVELFTELRSSAIDIPVILMSGYVEITDEQARSIGFARVLRKPARLRDIEQAIREVVGGA